MRRNGAHLARQTHGAQIGKGRDQFPHSRQRARSCLAAPPVAGDRRGVRALAQCICGLSCDRRPFARRSRSRAGPDGVDPIIRSSPSNPQHRSRPAKTGTAIDAGERPSKNAMAPSGTLYWLIEDSSAHTCRTEKRYPAPRSPEYSQQAEHEQSTTSYV